VLAVTQAQHLALVPVSDWVEDIPVDGWRQLSAGDGAKGPWLYDWAFLPFHGAVPGWTKGLLIRRSLAPTQELAFYLTHAPAETSLADLVRVAGKRWTIEAAFETAKGEVGLDQYEVRTWTGWHRHITLAMMALAFLTVTRKAVIGGRRCRSLNADLLPRTVALAPPSSNGNTCIGASSTGAGSHFGSSSAGGSACRIFAISSGVSVEPETSMIRRACSTGPPGSLVRSSTMVGFTVSSAVGSSGMIAGSRSG
jgi:hypothetical protein